MQRIETDERASRIVQFLALALTVFMLGAFGAVMSKVRLRPAPLQEEAPHAPLNVPGPVDAPRQGKCTGQALLNADGNPWAKYSCDEDPRRTVGPKNPPKDPKGPGHGRGPESWKELR